MDRKRINGFKYLTVLVITLAIFMIGMSVGNLLTQEKLAKLDDSEQELRLDTLGVELQYMILAEEPCIAVNTSTTTDELFAISEKLTFMENQLGVDNSDVINLKNYYSLLQIRHWLLMQRNQEVCNSNTTLIQYFYSNQGDCPECEQQGYILTYIRKKYPQVRVYPYDINLQNPAIKTIKEIYGVTQTPTIIIGDKTYNYFLTRTELEIILAGRVRKNETS